MQEIIQIEDQYYILATSSLADDRNRVLKQGETFGVFDRHGDIRQFGRGEQGIYHEGTRYVSRLSLRVGPHRPLLLSSNVKEDNAVLVVDLENPDLSLNGHLSVRRGTLHVSRSQFLWEGRYHEHCRITNYGTEEVSLDVSYTFDADFADIFEVRGIERERRGRLLPPELEKNGLRIGYEGLDGLRRTASLECSPEPAQVNAGGIRFNLKLAPKQDRSVYLSVACLRGDSPMDGRGYDAALSAAQTSMADRAQNDCEIHTSNEQFNNWIGRSFADLRMMVTDTAEGAYPYAGVPWFSAPFGRDGVITAMEALWVSPSMARGVLGYLAATQADSLDPRKDAEPGKILHEKRGGEMAALEEIPFGSYYGSVDSTPLFVALASHYYRRSADREFLESIWPNIQRALEWIDKWGDADGDGFVEYKRYSDKGLVNQGWKDSWDSVFHADGEFAHGPVALCEVQAYVYEAKREAAWLAKALGRQRETAELEAAAEDLRRRFEESFWCEDIAFYALALDGDKKPCRVRTSNAGHCLLTGIADRQRAARVADALLSDAFFSGWGIRTVASNESRYNPLSYHNGSIWPHDNALVAAGLSRYGFRPQIVNLFTGLFDAASAVDLNRMPELFCGFPRRPRQGPTLYPVACAPQAWASASVFLLLQACLGLSVDALRRQVNFAYPALPPWLEQVWINNLRVGDASIDLSLQRLPDDVGINVIERRGQVDVVARK